MHALRHLDHLDRCLESRCVLDAAQGLALLGQRGRAIADEETVGQN